MLHYSYESERMAQDKTLIISELNMIINKEKYKELWSPFRGDTISRYKTSVIIIDIYLGSVR